MVYTIVSTHLYIRKDKLDFFRLFSFSYHCWMKIKSCFSNSKRIYVKSLHKILRTNKICRILVLTADLHKIRQTNLVPWYIPSCQRALRSRKGKTKSLDDPFVSVPNCWKLFWPTFHKLIKNWWFCIFFPKWIFPQKERGVYHFYVLNSRVNARGALTLAYDLLWYEN
jgi:hypothetical protein